MQNGSNVSNRRKFFWLNVIGLCLIFPLWEVHDRSQHGYRLSHVSFRYCSVPQRRSNPIGSMATIDLTLYSWIGPLEIQKKYTYR